MNNCYNCRYNIGANKCKRRLIKDHKIVSIDLSKAELECPCHFVIDKMKHDYYVDDGLFTVSEETLNKLYKSIFGN
jgi:hypothetical protein